MSGSGDDANGLAVAAHSAATGPRRAGAWRRARPAMRAMRRCLAAAVVIPAAVALLIAFPALAQASIGVGVQGAPVRLGHVAKRGESYALTAVYVVNTGTQAESISLHVQRFTHRPGITVPPSWIHFSSNGVSLAAHDSARIPLQLVVPAGAEPGQYRSDIVVVGSAGVTVGRANLGVAAATGLEFTVGQGSVQGAGFRPWMLWTLGGLLLLGAAIFAFRASGLQVSVARRPTDGSAVDLRGGNHDTA
jgi:hypothetical protein